MIAQEHPELAATDTPTPGDPELFIRRAADIGPEPVQWLWPGNFALGKVAVVAGPAGGGKTLMVAGDFAARVSLGLPWPDGSPCPLGDVLIASGEDGAADTLVPRLVDHEADLARVHFVEGLRGGREKPRAFSLGDLVALERALRQRPETKLIVIDPVSAFMGRVGGNDNAGVRGLLSPLQELAQRRGAAVVLITHLRKAATANAVQAVIGSVGLVAAARTAWLLTRDPNDADRRLFTVAKNNLGQDRFGYAWRLVDRRVRWEEQRVDLTGDAALSDAGGLSPERGAVTREGLAAAFLADFLKDGPRTWAAVERAGKAAGHKPAALERSRCRIAETFRRGGRKGRWLWRLTGDVREEPVPDADEFFQVGIDDILFPDG